MRCPVCDENLEQTVTEDGVTLFYCPSDCYQIESETGEEVYNDKEKVSCPDGFQPLTGAFPTQE